MAVHRAGRRGVGCGQSQRNDIAAHVTQAPIEGVSFAHTFNQADAPTQHQTRYYEMFGHRSIYHDAWRAVCPRTGLFNHDKTSRTQRLFPRLDVGRRLSTLGGSDDRQDFGW